VTESLLGETERRDELVVEGLSSLWNDEDDSLRFKERSRVISRLVLLARSPFDSRPRSAPLGGESSLFLFLVADGVGPLDFDATVGEGIGSVVGVRGLACRC